MKYAPKQNAKAFFAFALAGMALASCGVRNDVKPNSTGDKQEPSSSLTRPEYEEGKPNRTPDPMEVPSVSETPSGTFDGVYTIRFDSRGGTEIAPLKVNKGEIATKPDDPVKSGSAFLGWYLDLSFVNEFNWANPVDSDYWLFAKYEGDVDPTPSTPDSQSSQSDTATNPVLPTGPYGPEGSKKNNWAIVGSGSIFTADWTVEGGISLYNNPGNPEDKGCVLFVTFAAGDTFKVSDGATWYGYEKVDQWADPANYGLSHFKAEDPTAGAPNIVCIEACVVDIYVNPYGNIWITPHAI